jgi:phage FluMu gp28-like protein
VARTIRFEGAPLYPKQRAAIYDPNRISCIEASTKAGKTVGCLAWIIEQSLTGRSGWNYWWVAPVFGQAEIAFRRCWNMLAPIKAMSKRNQSSMYITMPNGTRIWFKSGERPDDLYGEDVYGAVLDEASRMREEAWHAIRSTLTYTKGPVRIIGNVRGRKNWFYKISRLAESGADDMAFHRLTAWDAVQSGVLDKREIESARRDFERLGQPEVFRQLYMAEALDDGTNPFGLAAIAACCEGIEDYSQEMAIAAGVDLAGRGAINIEKVGDAESRDWTAIVALDRKGNATWVDRFRKPHRETMSEITRRVKRTMCLMDSTGTGDALVEDLQRRGDMRVLGYTFTDRTRQDLLEGLALAIQEGSIRFPDLKTSDGKGSLRDELESFEFTYSIKGVRYEVPTGSDDIAMALALAVKRMPWRRTAQMNPVALPAGSSPWHEDHEGSEAWRIHTQAKNPVLSDAKPTGPAPAMPTVIGGGGPSNNRWSGGG